MYSNNDFLMNILKDLKTVLCPLKSNSNTIELTVETLLVVGVLDLLRVEKTLLVVVGGACSCGAACKNASF